MALDVETARSIVKAVRADAACRARIEGTKFSAIIRFAFGGAHLAGGVRNLAMILRGLGPEHQIFVHLSCVGIAMATQRVIYSEMLAGRLPKVQGSLIRRRRVSGFEHKGTGVAMKDGSDYVFDWWPTLDLENPLISTLSQWVKGGTTVELEDFKGLL